ncbi:hypothetical protein F66182_18502, partial [Fusarium sp. NRRL 66182]
MKTTESFRNSNNLTDGAEVNANADWTRHGFIRDVVQPLRQDLEYLSRA